MTKGIFSLVFFLVVCYLSCSVVAWLFHNYFVKFLHCVMNGGAGPIPALCDFIPLLLSLWPHAQYNRCSCGTWGRRGSWLGCRLVAQRVFFCLLVWLWLHPPSSPHGPQAFSLHLECKHKKHILQHHPLQWNREKCTLDKDAWKHSHVKLDLKTKWSQLEYYHVIIIIASEQWMATQFLWFAYLSEKGKCFTFYFVAVVLRKQFHTYFLTFRNTEYIDKLKCI